MIITDRKCTGCETLLWSNNHAGNCGPCGIKKRQKRAGLCKMCSRQLYDQNLTGYCGHCHRVRYSNEQPAFYHERHLAKYCAAWKRRTGRAPF